MVHRPPQSTTGQSGHQILVSLLIIFNSRMCRGILDDKTIKLEMMNNINMTQQVETVQQQQKQPPPSVGPDERLPEKVLEMYNMLLGITTELEKIKYQMAKRESSDGEEGPGRGSNHVISF